MDLRKLKTILELFEGSSLISELEVSEGDDRIKLSKAVSSAVVAAPALPAASPAAEEQAPPVPDGTPVTAPMVGTFYRASSPEASPFVRVGDSVEVGQTLCIIEAMKLMNEIPSTVAGKVVDIVADNGAAVSFGAPLFLIK